MSWIAVAVAGAAVVGAGATMVSASMSSKAAKAAAEAQKDAAEKGADTQWAMFEATQKAGAPFVAAGTEAIPEWQKLMKEQPGEFIASPEYKLGRDTGIEAIERLASARGNVLSPRTQQAVVEFNNEYNKNAYQNFYNNWLNQWRTRMGQYSSLAGMGQASAANQAAIGATTGANIADAYTNAGNATAAGAINSANAWTGAINTGSNALLNAYLYNRNSYNQPVNTGYANAPQGYQETYPADTGYQNYVPIQQ